jgi:hypothetical protein
MSVKRRLDLTQLNAVPAALDHMVAAPEKVIIAILPQ